MAGHGQTKSLALADNVRRSFALPLRNARMVGSIARFIYHAELPALLGERAGVRANLCSSRSIGLMHKLHYHAPNLSNIFAFACISRIKYFASKTPSEPRLAPVTVKRSSLSEPQSEE